MCQERVCKMQPKEHLGFRKIEYPRFQDQQISSMFGENTGATSLFRPFHIYNERLQNLGNATVIPIVRDRTLRLYNRELSCKTREKNTCYPESGVTQWKIVWLCCIWSRWSLCWEINLRCSETGNTSGLIFYLDQEMCHCFPALDEKYFRSSKGSLWISFWIGILRCIKFFDQNKGSRKEILERVQGRDTKLKSDDVFDLFQEIQWLQRSFLSAVEWRMLRWPSKHVR